MRNHDEGKNMTFMTTREEPLIQIDTSNSSDSQNLIDKTQSNNSKEKFSKQFDIFLIESIDEALSLLGVTVKNEFYLRLKVNFNIEKNDIPQKLEEFMLILHRIFNFGASRLEVKFLRNLDLKIPYGSKCVDSEWSVSMWIEKDISFIKSIQNKRQEFLKTE